MQISTLLYTALNLLVPGLCPTCNTATINSIYPICSQCMDALSYRKYFSMKYSEYIPEIYSCFIYADIVKKCIKTMKYGRKKNMVLVFNKTIEEMFTSLSAKKSIQVPNKLHMSHKTCHMKLYDLIVPVPIHPERKRVRGFNQSEIITDHISKIIKIPASSSVLLKTKNTAPQTHQTLTTRIDNLTGAFAAIPGTSIFKKNILLVDDVVTTGTTLETCAKELLKSGAKSVTGFTLARTL